MQISQPLTTVILLYLLKQQNKVQKMKEMTKECI